MTCCGFGHRLLLTDIEKPLRETLERLVAERSVTLFYTGGMGEFDELFARTVRSIKRNDSRLRLVLVLPYLTKRLNDDREIYETSFDELLIPTALDGAHRKAAIPLRNRWMIDHSDFIVAALRHTTGGAAEAVRYAKNSSKEVFFCENAAIQR